MAGIVKRESDGELFLHIRGRYRTADGTRYFDQLPRSEALQLLKVLTRELAPTPAEVASIGGPWRPARWCKWKKAWKVQVRYRLDGDVDVRELPPATNERSRRRWTTPWRIDRDIWETVGELL